MSSQELGTLDAAIKRALDEPTLIDALSFLSIWDTERAIAQAKRNNFASWETTSKYLFSSCIEQWKLQKHLQQDELLNHVDPSKEPRS